MLPDNKINQHRAKYISGRPTVNIQQNTYSSVSGQDVTISCVVSSNPTASISWIFISTGNSQTQITTSNAKYSLTTSSGGSSLVVRNSNSGDSGTYRCTATNTVGSASDSASLTVSGSRSHRFRAEFKLHFRLFSLGFFLSCQGTQVRSNFKMNFRSACGKHSQLYLHCGHWTGRHNSVLRLRKSGGDFVLLDLYIRV